MLQAAAVSQEPGLPRSPPSPWARTSSSWALPVVGSPRRRGLSSRTVALAALLVGSYFVALLRFSPC